jgi:hypothetical protein
MSNPSNVGGRPSHVIPAKGLLETTFRVPYGRADKSVRPTKESDIGRPDTPVRSFSTNPFAGMTLGRSSTFPSRLFNLLLALSLPAQGMTVRPLRHIGLIAGFCLVVGCSNPFAPPNIGPRGGAPIKPLTSPENVLDNLVYAYEQRDIDVYETLLDPDFVFVYFDPDRIEGIETVVVPRDGPSGDLERTRRLFRVFDEIRISVFDTTATSADSSGPRVLQMRRVAFQLTLRDLSGDFGYESFEATGDAMFWFGRSTSGGLWHIVRWEDLSNQ